MIYIDAIKQLILEKGISEESVYRILKEALIAAYKKKFGTAENAEIEINERNGDVKLYAIKKIVEEVKNPALEINIEEAKNINKDSEVGYELKIELDPSSFGRIPTQRAKQVVMQEIRKMEKNSIYSTFKGKVGELITGKVQRKRGGTIYVAIGNSRIEAILPVGEQSPKEYYEVGDRIKCYVKEVEKKGNNPYIILSRKSPELIKKLFEIDIPEIAEGVIEVKSIAREVGYKTKIAVRSLKGNIEPVGACVGVKGVRIQSIVKEIGDEKIDVIRYSDDPAEYIKNALTPATPIRVIITDEKEKNAIAVIPEKQVYQATGKQGINVRLAKELTGWDIVLKTEKEIENLEEEIESERTEDEFDISILGLPTEINKILRKNGINSIEDIVPVMENGFKDIDGISEEMIETIKQAIDENVEIVVEEEVEEEEVYDEGEGKAIYYCPECGSEITEDMTRCPGCGVEIVFEEEE